MDTGSTSEIGAEPTRTPRVSGLWLFIGIVVIGVGAGAGYYRFAAPRAKAETERRLAEGPSTDEGRVETWVEYVEPVIRERLAQARISAQQPWIVTHTIAGAEGEAPEVWGIETEALTAGVVRADGLRAILTLPEPALLAEAVLVGDHANSVPSFPSGQAPDNADELLTNIATYALQTQIKNLAKDIPGAELVIAVEGR